MPEKQDVREACLTEALSIISKTGIESLSLREVSRRLKISHQAPYKHFESRDHILAVVIARAFADLANHLETSLSLHALSDVSDEKLPLATIGQSYLEYALLKPLQYRLMFLTSLPDLGKYPEVAENATRVFSTLRGVIKKLKPSARESDVTKDALFAWSTVHGLASIMQFNSLSALGLKAASQQHDAILHTMKHVCDAMDRNH